MNLTDTFWGIAFGVSLVFGICCIQSSIPSSE